LPSGRGATARLGSPIFRDGASTAFWDVRKRKLAGFSVVCHAMMRYGGRKPFTKSELLATLKEIGIATKKDVADIVHNQLTEFHAEMIALEFQNVTQRLDRMDVRLDGVEERLGHVEKQLDTVEVGLGRVEHKVDALSADTLTKVDFNDVKVRVRRLEIARGNL
jgi:hypothetical protein